MFLPVLLPFASLHIFTLPKLIMDRHHTGAGEEDGGQEQGEARWEQGVGPNGPRPYQSRHGVLYSEAGGGGEERGNVDQGRRRHA